MARACDRDDLRALAAMPGIRLGGHTVTHSVMSRQSPRELLRETAECRAQLAEVLGLPGGTVRSRINRARGMLKRRLQPMLQRQETT